MTTDTSEREEGAERRTVKGRVLIAKLGLDGHDVGAKAIVRYLRDKGYEVVYLGIRQRPENVARAALDEDVDLVGISMLSGAHLLLVPRVVQVLHERGADIPVLLGGTIPPDDFEDLKQLGVAAVFTPGTPLQVIADKVNELIGGRG